MMVLEMSISWEPENIGWNVTQKSEEYLPNFQDHRRVASSNITVKVTDKIFRNTGTHRIGW